MPGGGAGGTADDLLPLPTMNLEEGEVQDSWPHGTEASGVQTAPDQPAMTEEQRFEQFIELCKRIYERMEREGSWPWPEGTIKGGDAESGEINS